MTRVVKIEKTGGPEVLKFETAQLGKPGPEEVLIEHKAIGLNFIDTYHRSGLYPLKLPSGIGGEGSGIIKEIGSKVKDSTLILLTKGEKIKVTSITKSKFLLVSGKPIGEPIARGGPFVMNTKKEILKAVEDYNNGNFVQK